MQRKSYSLLPISLLLCTLAFLESCSTVNLNKQSVDSNSTIVRVYVGLNSAILDRSIEVDEVERIISGHFNAATLQESTGFYEGEREESLIVTIINCCRWEEPSDVFRDRINNLVLQLREDLGQNSILVEYISHGRNEVFEVF